ncbi:hypothetical protein [Intrasporangium mesophilum]
MRATTARTGTLILVAAILSISACSSSSQAYCDALTSAESEWASAGASLQNKEAATHFVATVRQIEVKAPDEVRSEWISLESLFEKFTVDKPDLTALTQQMQGFESAAKKIETHAKETCGIDLSK